VIGENSIPLPAQSKLTISRLYVFRPFVLVLSDSLALMLSLGLAVFVKAQTTVGVTLTSYVKLWPFIFVFLCSYWMSGLYARVALSHPEELERGTACSCCIFLSLSAATHTLRGAQHFITTTLLICILLNFILMPLLREVCRTLFSKSLVWGHQAVIFGSGEQARALIERSQADKGTGIQPIALIDPSAHDRPYLCGLPIFSSVQEACLQLDDAKPTYGIVTAGPASSAEMIRLIDSPESIIFSRIVLLSNASAMSSMWAAPLAKGPRLRLSAKHRTTTLTYKVWKRLFDIALASITLLTLLPLMALLALSVKVSSDGPFLFGHKRLGRGGRKFKAWKFRTMRTNGDLILAEWLKSNAAAREEWIRDHKLTNDPRVTKLGRFLRATSLDELPQLWNVIRGDMSLVGPRPIVDGEVHHYGEDYDLYSQVQGGVTGMWQVSGRSSTTYRERVMLDSFYVTHRSIWLDLAIILRTVGVVLLRRGAV
jgi:Undecaprenyl-phosphate galactose phosphotransferase WbaP